MHKKLSPALSMTIHAELHGETPRERLLHRLHSVALVLKGYSASEAARFYGDSPRAVAYWVRRFRTLGTVGLEEIPRSGRPSRLSKQQFKTLQTFVKHSQKQSESMNAEKLSAFILSRFEISLTTRQCWRILNKLKS